MNLNDDFNISYLNSFTDISSWNYFLQNNDSSNLIFFLGRSNVGKSSLINFLFQKKLAHVSQVPGKTKMVNVFEIIQKKLKKPSSHFLIDLPGYGHAKISKEERAQWDDFLGKVFESLDDKCHLLCLQDSRHAFSNMDLIFLDFLKGIPLSKSLILTKFDQCKTQKDKSELEKIIKNFSGQYHFDNIFKVSINDEKSSHKLKSYLKLLFA